MRPEVQQVAVTVRLYERRPVAIHYKPVLPNNEHTARVKKLAEELREALSDCWLASNPRRTT